LKDRYARLEDLGLTLICADGRDHPDGKHRELSPEQCDARELSSGAVALSCPACHFDVAIFDPVENIVSYPDSLTHAKALAREMLDNTIQTVEKLDAITWDLLTERGDRIEKWVLFFKKHTGDEATDAITAMYEAVGPCESAQDLLTAYILIVRIEDFFKIATTDTWWDEMLNDGRRCECGAKYQTPPDEHAAHCPIRTGENKARTEFEALPALG
jgi:hypothetical protein